MKKVIFFVTLILALLAPHAVSYALPPCIPYWSIQQIGYCASPSHCQQYDNSRKYSSRKVV